MILYNRICFWFVIFYRVFIGFLYVEESVSIYVFYSCVFVLWGIMFFIWYFLFLKYFNGGIVGVVVERDILCVYCKCIYCIYVYIKWFYMKCVWCIEKCFGIVWWSGILVLRLWVCVKRVSGILCKFGVKIVGLRDVVDSRSEVGEVRMEGG